MDIRSVLNALPPVLVHQGERVVYANSAACRLFGRKSGQLVGTSMSALIERYGGEDGDKLASGDGLVHSHFRAVRSDGAVLTVDVATTPITFDGEQTLLSILHDQTEQRGIQSRLLLADRLASVGRLAAGVGHEINNPLAYVAGNIGFAVTYLKQTLAELDARAPEESAESALLTVVVRIDEVCEALEEARQGANRVRQIVRDLKTFSRADDERRGPADIRRVLESCINMAWNEIRHRARLVKIYGDTPRVDAAESRLGQVFLNLLLNAAQSIPEGHVDENEIRVTTGVDAHGRVAVEIRDTGAGIPPEHLGRVFDPFFTTKPVGEGTGLGLAIVHGIVTAIGGEVSAQTEVGKGTAFRVALPASPLQSTKSGIVAVASRPVRACRVLVVDDEPLVLKAVARMLSSDQHDVATAADGREALARLDAGETFDVILCDLMMPRMTGMELHAALTCKSPDVAARMVFLTGGAFTTGAQAFLTRVQNLHLEKPFEPGTLREALRVIVGA